MHHFLVQETQLGTTRKFNTPFFYFKGKWLGYLNYQPKKRQIFVSLIIGGEVQHPKLIAEGRKKIQIHKIVAEQDINTTELSIICQLLKNLYI